MISAGSFTPRLPTPMLSGMKIHEIRWTNFRRLAEAGNHGWIQRAADTLGKSHAQVSQFGGDAPRKNIGEKIAREIEAAYGIATGALDSLNNSALPTKGTVASPAPSRDLDIACLAQAVQWVRFEEARAGVPYHPERHAQRLMSLYRQIEADGGSLSPEHAEAIISSKGEAHAAPGSTAGPAVGGSGGGR